MSRPGTEPVQTNIGFVSKSHLKVGCVNPLDNGLAKACLLFWPQPPPTEGLSRRLISGGSPEVPTRCELKIVEVHTQHQQTRLMEPQILPFFSSSLSHMHVFSPSKHMHRECYCACYSSHNNVEGVCLLGVEQ